MCIRDRCDVVLDQVHERATAVLRALAGAVLRSGAAAHEQEHILAVVAAVGLEAELDVLIILVDDDSFRLLGAELVPAHAAVRALLLAAGLAVGREAVVPEAALVVLPRDAGELAPLERFVEVLAGVDVAHMQLLPVTARRRQPVTEQCAVVGIARAGERDRAVLAELVGIEHDYGLACETLLHVEHVLILQTVILAEEIAAALARREGVALVVEERLQTVFNLSLIHISEPTRLLSISYAVFCLKK